MEAMSPTFAEVKSKAASRKTVRPAATPSLAGFQAASVRLPLCFVLVGVLSLLVGGGFLLAQPDLLATYHYTPHVLAVTHLFVLGFISSIVMGAMYQLVPVTLEVQLHSERLVKFQFAVHVLGFAGMVWAFWDFNMARVGIFGSVLTFGVGLFVFNLVRTLAMVKGWRASKCGIASALFWLSATVLAGLLLVGTKFWGFSPFLPLAAMHAHAHLGVIGAFVLMIVTVSYKLVPMFTLSELQSERRAWWSVSLLNLGLLGAFAAILWQSPLKLVFAAVIVVALMIYGWEILAILRARNRRTLDWGMKYFLTAIALLILWPDRTPWPGRVGDSGDALQDCALSRVVSQLQPANRPSKSAGAGGHVLRAAANRGLLDLFGRTRRVGCGDRVVARNRYQVGLRSAGVESRNFCPEHGEDSRAFRPSKN